MGQRNNRNIKTSVLLAMCLLSVMRTFAQETQIGFMPEVHGTIRGKYEYQPEDKKGRFEVRNARFSLSGYVAKAVEYKAEIDLSDEGQIKMLDAYTRLHLSDQLCFTIGQMRVPFTIDVPRSPHQQYFANRSFIAKQVGNVRDVGATVGYRVNIGFPIIADIGLFNGSGLTNQKDFWTNEVNFAGKIQFVLPRGFNLTLSAQKIKPDATAIMMYDFGTYYQAHRWHIEAEYLYKHYADGIYRDVHAFDGFINYDIPLQRCFFSKVSPLIRYDYMSDHSDGVRYLDGIANTTGKLITTDYQRSRITGGVTLSIDKPFISDIRINYEKYFYRSGAVVKPSEKDKFVIEVMTRF